MRFFKRYRKKRHTTRLRLIYNANKETDMNEKQKRVKVIRLPYCILIVLSFVVTRSAAQSSMPDEIDAVYAARFEEKGGMKPTVERKINLALKDGEPILSVILCGGCFPATFTYDEKLSEGFGEYVFKNSLGIYMLVYNEKGFAVVVPSSDGNKTFQSVNLYTRSKKDYDTITKEKLRKYSKKLLDLI